MIKKDVTILVNELRKDSRYLRLFDLFKTSPLYRIPVLTLTDEVTALHQSRAVRRLNVLDPNIIDALVNAVIIDQSSRSRLTEIVITCLRVSTSLQDALEALKHYLLATYQEELRQFRTKDERSVVLDMTLRQFYKFIVQVNLLKTSSELVIQDIDKAAWSMKSLIEALKIHQAREVTV